MMQGMRFERTMGIYRGSRRTILVLIRILGNVLKVDLLRFEKLEEEPILKTYGLSSNK